MEYLSTENPKRDSYQKVYANESTSRVGPEDKTIITLDSNKARLAEESQRTENRGSLAQEVAEIQASGTKNEQGTIDSPTKNEKLSNARAKTSVQRNLISVSPWKSNCFVSSKAI